MQAEDIRKKKFDYLLCNQGDLHEGEQLNYVFIDSKVSQSVLMCPVCKSQAGEKKQRIMPLKIFLAEASTYLQTKPNSFQTDTLTSQIELIHQKMLQALKDSVQKMAVQIKEIEDQINNNFKQIKQRLVDQLHTSQNFPLLFQHIIENNYDTVQKLKQDVFKITENIQYAAGKIELEFKPQKVVDQYSRTLAEFVTALNLSNTNFKGSIVKVQKTLEKIVLLKPNAAYHFSATLKHAQISIHNGKRVTSSSQDQCFALIEPGLDTMTKSRFAIKILNLKYWIGLGICYSKIVKANDYVFVKQTINHGSHMLCTSGEVCSNAMQQQHPNTGVTFAVGDTMICECDPIAKTLQFKKVSVDGNILIHQEDIPDINDMYACVGLGCSEDSAEFMVIDEEQF